jgi:2-oxoisovalerate dehydrogenase E1 component alpha subunit
MYDNLDQQPDRISFIDREGRGIRDLPEAVNVEWLLRSYRHMVLIRALDKKAVALQRTGQMSTYPSCLGQEAVGTGAGMAMQEEDIFVPYYRDQAAQTLRGVKLHQILQTWGGDERGNVFEGVAKKDLPLCIPIANQMSHAAGVAVALKIRGTRQAVVTTIGDGGTSRGDFYESLNLAGVWQLPLVTLINNNQWAISVPRSLQTGTRTLSQKAVAAGIEGVQVDGNDVVAVYDTVAKALHKARCGKCATLIEAVTYRLSDHTTADDATRYREASQVSQAWEYEPIKRLQTWLHANRHWDPDKEQTLLREVQQEVDEAVATYLNQTPQQVDDFMSFIYEEMDHSLQEQRAELLDRQSRYRGGAHGD